MTVGRRSRSRRPSTTRRSIVPLGGILGPAQSVDGPVAYSRDAPQHAHRLELAVHPDERHRRRPSLDPVGQPRRPVRPAEPRRPVRHAGQPARPRRDHERPARSPTPRPASRSRKSGLTTTFEATNVRDFAFTAAPDYRSISATVGGVTRPRLLPAGLPGVDGPGRRRSTRSRRCEPLVGPYPVPDYDLAQTAGGYGMESPGLTWIPTGVALNLAYLVPHETGHQWFYGIVGNDQAYAAVRRRGGRPTSSPATSSASGARRAARRPGSTCRSTSTRARCYYEIVYIQGGNFIDDLRKTMGSTAFWDGIRDYLAANRFKIAPTKALLAHARRPHVEGPRPPLRAAVPAAVLSAARRGCPGPADVERGWQGDAYRSSEPARATTTSPRIRAWRWSTSRVAPARQRSRSVARHCKLRARTQAALAGRLRRESVAGPSGSGGSGSGRTAPGRSTGTSSGTACRCCRRRR